MIHLTQTGPFAGVTLCGASRTEKELQGDRFAHAAYAPIEHPEICPECRKVWQLVLNSED